jgi:hypothetical protein
MTFFYSVYDLVNRVMGWWMLTLPPKLFTLAIAHVVARTRRCNYGVHVTE